MDKPLIQSDRDQLPAGWDWADWTGTADAKVFWNELTKDQKTKQDFRARMGATRDGFKYGELVDRTIYFVAKESDGIGKLKVHRPRPGIRACAFQVGRLDFRITHFYKKDPDDKGQHAAQIRIAQDARTEHKARQKKPRPK